VKRLLSLTLGFALLAAWCGCGGKFFIRGGINTGSISGSVSAVELSIVSDDGASVTVTQVTFLVSKSLSGDVCLLLLLLGLKPASFLRG
jgi:hypothetical protein